MRIIKYICAGVVVIGAFAAWFISQPQMEPLMTPERKARI